MFQLCDLPDFTLTKLRQNFFGSYCLFGAPEFEEKSKVPTPKSSVYLIGLCALYISTGKLTAYDLYNKQSLLDNLKKIDVFQKLDQNLQEVIWKMLQFDPKKRISFQQLKNDKLFHPFKKDKKKYKNTKIMNSIGNNNNNINYNIISQMKLTEFEKTALIQQLLTNDTKLNNSFLTYLLLQNKDKNKGVLNNSLNNNNNQQINKKNQTNKGVYMDKAMEKKKEMEIETNDKKYQENRKLISNKRYFSDQKNHFNQKKEIIDEKIKEKEEKKKESEKNQDLDPKQKLKSKTIHHGDLKDGLLEIMGMIKEQQENIEHSQKEFEKKMYNIFCVDKSINKSNKINNFTLKLDNEFSFKMENNHEKTEKMKTNYQKYLKTVLKNENNNLSNKYSPRQRSRMRRNETLKDTHLNKSIMSNNHDTNDCVIYTHNYNNKQHKKIDCQLIRSHTGKRPQIKHAIKKNFSDILTKKEWWFHNQNKNLFQKQTDHFISSYQQTQTINDCFESSFSSKSKKQLLEIFLLEFRIIGVKFKKISKFKYLCSSNFSNHDITFELHILSLKGNIKKKDKKNIALLIRKNSRISVFYSFWNFLLENMNI
ncbi:serine/threonine-protein kinase nek [Anaeramoeba flamelloides]|uniref:Serine/threonine-protein kinase nek n=1 Tax=Anaeramoeba flamelloides TaxID=1746091 RepID=A0AAV7ZI94_9EUKA|nr:serine/threonine-protein kinase nek [Anaeramoeba flamelloides]